MARSRPALQQAVNEILIRHGEGGKRMSYRQAERLTGLSPATVGELAKGNARTPETIRRFAIGFGEDVERLLILAGFFPDDLPAASLIETSSPSEAASEGEDEIFEHEWLARYGRALDKMPRGSERDLWRNRLRQETELLEAFLALLQQSEKRG